MQNIKESKMGERIFISDIIITINGNLTDNTFMNFRFTIFFTEIVGNIRR